MLQIICSLDSMEYPEFPQEGLSSFDEIYRLDGTVEVFEGKNNTSKKQEDALKVRKRKKKSGDNEESQKQKRKEVEKKIQQKIHKQQQFLREQRLEERRKEKELQQRERKQISMAKASEYRKAIAPNEMPMAFNFSEIKPMGSNYREIKLPEKLPQNCVRVQAKPLFKKVLPESKLVKNLSKPTLKVIMPNVNSPLIGAIDTLVINTFDIKTDLQPINPVSDSVTNHPKKRRKLIELENIFSKIVENMEMSLTRRIQDRFSVLNLFCIKESSW